MSFLLNSFSSTCGMYFAQRVSMPTWHSCSECFAFCDGLVSVLPQAYCIWVFSNGSPLTVFWHFSVIFYLSVAPLPLQAAPGFYRDKDSRDTTWTFLVLQCLSCFPCCDFFFLIFWWSFIRIFVFYWGIPLRMSPECLCSYKSWVFFYWFQLG